MPTVPPPSVQGECARLLRTDHYEHEDIIGFLQDSADPYATPFLREAIRLKPKLDYLEYDDYGAYFKRCLWALVAIGTPNAITVIQECAESDDPVLREQALYRLSKLKK